ncbi:hypothetical protein JTF52_gp09 [Microbacterium phage Azizam]|uniref:Minor tail protein n=7 Tax=Paopuvirus TaxID=2948855 RepID=A0A2R4A079_9CAUD|nr:hypothetical protein JTF51_gp09 [Microbacterium phage PaoPu]YP_009996619.1 hypothetical protein JTF52_gp09 [Microbacterium phage Azizam]YP_009996644.1 hypothetical protein JTF53_gp09 [Microbacterium phage Bri160]YP_009996669.1 hypothetical protein JTF54_gp09 [Microbacterium phage Kaijohn]YP_009996695.1 hypothetical protein JTF55_gp09 [Microbacterium phage Nobel]YP_009996770.1 minor tail protein [Microbacterium phage Quaker]YP_010050607.1 hypothetical protein KDJ09_gp09 [Microbacterium phag
MAEYQNRGIRIDGLRELNAKLRAAGDESADLPDLMFRLGSIVIANARVPAKSGELAGTLRAGRGRTKAVVRAGYAKRGAHAGVVHYGNPHTGSRAQPFLVDALRRAQSQLVSELQTGIDQLMRKHKL